MGVNPFRCNCRTFCLRLLSWVFVGNLGRNLHRCCSGLKDFYVFDIASCF